MHLLTMHPVIGLLRYAPQANTSILFGVAIWVSSLTEATRCGKLVVAEQAASSKRLMCSLKGLFAALVRLIEQIEKRAQMMALPGQMIAKQLPQNQGVSHKKLCQNAGKAPTFVGCVLGAWHLSIFFWQN